jgi:hypothetical protein
MSFHIVHLFYKRTSCPSLPSLMRIAYSMGEMKIIPSPEEPVYEK